MPVAVVVVVVLLLLLFVCFLEGNNIFLIKFVYT